MPNQFVRPAPPSAGGSTQTLGKFPLSKAARFRHRLAYNGSLVTQVTDADDFDMYVTRAFITLQLHNLMESKMKRTLLAFLLFSSASIANAQSWRMLPIMDADHQFKPTIALTGGKVDPDNAPSAGNVGVELSFNCGLIQSPDNRIRSYLQVNRSDKNNLKATAFELSPRYTVPLGENLTIGAGPSLTAVNVKTAAVSKTVYGAGVAAGLDWRVGSLYAGFDVRWHDTSSKNGVQFDSTAIGLKVGVNF